MAKKHSNDFCNATLHITRQQYRAFAEITKSFGMGLNLSTVKSMGCWGEYSPWALLVCKDASEPDTKWSERALITLANSINTGKFRAAGAQRPELNWAALKNDEIHPFVVWHEIGHRMDNFDSWGIIVINDLKVRNKCHRQIRLVNEVLADRYAWERIRPGNLFHSAMQALSIMKRPLRQSST